jgi:pyrimidine operon attenuation protein/uracil phosphoribosyltransferase
LSTIILTEKQINQKIKRIAFQILENNIDEPTLFLAGIAKNGFLFAEKIQKELINNSDKDIVLVEVNTDKKNPLDNVYTSINIKDMTDKSVVLVDDVLNSGRTLIYAIRHFLEVPLKSFKTAVLVNRNHKNYPVKADFKGISLSTSLEEHIEVSFDQPAKAVLY